MSFPLNDQYWRDAADFVQAHIKNGEKLIAPSEFEAKFPEKTSPYSSAYTEISFQWAVIHKDMLKEIDNATLKRITKEFIPVFANEVFVIFSTHKELPEVDRRSPHIISFWEKVKSVEITLRDSHGLINNFKEWIINIDISNKKRIKKIPLLNKFAKHIYYKLSPIEEIVKSYQQESSVDYSTLSTTEIKKIMDERYKKKEAYNITCLWDKIRAEELNKKVTQLISPTKDKKILEIGCGIGGSANYISECKEFIGTDLSEAAISQAIKTFGNKPNFKFIPMDAMDLKFDDNSMDVVIAKEVIEHLPTPQKAIKETFRILKFGGLLVLTSPNRDSFHLRVNRMLGNPDFTCSFDHIKEFTFKETCDMLRSEGFTIEETSGVFLQPYWGIPSIDNKKVRHLTDNDPHMVEILKELGERVGAEYAFCFVILAVKL